VLNYVRRHIWGSWDFLWHTRQVWSLCRNERGPGEYYRPHFPTCPFDFPDAGVTLAQEAVWFPALSWPHEQGCDFRIQMGLTQLVYGALRVAACLTWCSFRSCRFFTSSERAGGSFVSLMVRASLLALQEDFPQTSIERQSHLLFFTWRHEHIQLSFSQL
jgi:hypothetical protein